MNHRCTVQLSDCHVDLSSYGEVVAWMGPLAGATRLVLLALAGVAAGLILLRRRRSSG